MRRPAALLIPVLAASSALAFQRPPQAPSTSRAAVSPSLRHGRAHHRRGAAPLFASPPPPSSSSDAREKERLLSELNDLTESFDMVQETVARNAALYAKRMKDYEVRVRTLEAELMDAARRAEAAEERAEEAAKELVRAASEGGSDEGEDEIARLKAEVESLSVAREKAEAEAEESGKNVQKAREALEEAKAELEKERGMWEERMRESAEEAKSKIDEKEGEVRMRKVSLENANKELKLLQSTSQAKEGELLREKSQLNEKIREQQSVISDMEAKVKELDEALQLLKDTDSAKEEQRSKWEVQIINLTKERDSLLKTIDSLQEKVESAAAKVKADMTSELIWAKAANNKEKDAMVRQMKAALEQREGIMRDMEEKLELYERERTSLRRLFLLTLRRIGSFFRIRRRQKTMES